MRMLRNVSAASLGLALVLGGVASVRADLAEYVKRPEPKYTWTLKEKIDHPLGTVYDLRMTSQVWQDIPWEHQLQVYQPKDAKPNGVMFLWNTGGNANQLTILLGMEIAKRVKAPVAFLYNIPNQPLLDGKKEDALIAETFVRYLKTKDENWPLLFPMVKSVVKAMDTLQAFSEKEWKQPTKQFIISGGSKRGWTSWLTGAADPRVKAIAPLVIDVLNMQQQMPHQLKSFGDYSQMIQDYTNTGLVPMPTSPEAKKLWNMVDPWAYRDRLTMPKLMILGNNDPYWTVDALNLYWDDLKGDKYVMYVPNAGHDLRQMDKDGKPDFSRVVGGLSAWTYIQSNGKKMPKLDWMHENQGDKLALTAATDQVPKGARLWVATAPTRDFRKATWNEAPATLKDNVVTGSVQPPKEGCIAFYAELDYEVDGLKYHLSTQMRVAGTPVPVKK